MLEDYDYALPPEQIAGRPAPARDASRLLHVAPQGVRAHLGFSDIEALLHPGDVLVVNDSRVLRARLEARKLETGGRVEILLVEPEADGWLALLGASKKVREGQILALAGGEHVEVREDRGGGMYRVHLPEPAPVLAARHGALPLPPYLNRPADGQDDERYQTVYARGEERSVAAPTAGLHFTPELLARLEARGIERRAVTLHVGPGTFLPVRTEDEADHEMHAERYEVNENTARALRRAREEGRRLVAVGTTAVRVLESFEGRAGAGSTQLFIRPGFRFRWVDALLTNFHLPRSTLLMLVAAFGGRGRVLDAYREAVREGYRFYSYGDAMFLERDLSGEGI